jgi:DNA end-binding protein Ku
MARPIWRGNITFGLVNIPVALFTAEKPSEKIHFHLVDKATHSRIHNQRIDERGKVIPWENIEHAYEFEKGKFVIVDQKMLEKAAANNYETVEINEFVPLNQINPMYFAKPYYLLPGDSGIKGYLLLHDILQRTKRVGIANVVIKTREHIAAILPYEECLMMIILRFGDELHALKDFPDLKTLHDTKIKIKGRELELAEQLVGSMSNKWDPSQYHDESKAMLMKLIKTDIKKGKTVASKNKVNANKKASDNIKSDKIVDFMDLLKQSVKAKEKGSKGKTSGNKRKA